MLRVLRENSQSFVIYLIFAPIILVFAFTFGPGASSCTGGAGVPYAAIVDGEIIRQQDFALNLNRRLDMLRQQMRGMTLTNEMIEQFGIREQVLDELVNQELLAQEAERRDLQVSDDELLRYLEERYGVKQVDFETYEAWVRRTFQMSVPQFEDQARRELMGQKLAEALSSQITVSEDELLRQFNREHDRVQYYAVKLDPNAQKVAEPSQAEIDALLTAEPDALKARYDEDQLLYRTPMQARPEQIVLSLARDASEAEVAAAKNQLQALREQVSGGADFAALAKQHSQDQATRDKGGDMGFVRRGMLAKDLEQVVFELEAGEVADEIVRTPMGLHLVRVAEIKPPEAKAFEDVQREVATSLLRSRAQAAAARGQAEALLAKLKAGESLESLTRTDEPTDDAAGATEPVRTESPWVLRSQEALPRIGVAPEAQAALFQATSEQPVLDQVFEIGRSFYVFVLRDKEVPDMSKFADSKDSLRDQAVAAKQRAVLDDWLRHLRESTSVRLNPEVFPAADAAS